MKRGAFVEIWTYGSYDELNDVDFGMSFEVPKKWLETKISEYNFNSLEDFLNEYTWDLTFTIHNDAKCDRVILNKKSGMFGHTINN